MQNAGVMIEPRNFTCLLILDSTTIIIHRHILVRLDEESLWPKLFTKTGWPKLTFGKVVNAGIWNLKNVIFPSTQLRHGRFE